MLLYAPLYQVVCMWLSEWASHMLLVIDNTASQNQSLHAPTLNDYTTLVSCPLARTSPATHASRHSVSEARREAAESVLVVGVTIR